MKLNITHVTMDGLAICNTKTEMLRIINMELTFGVEAF